MALVAALVALAHVSDHGVRVLGLGLEGGDEGILGLDGEGVRTPLAAKPHGVFGGHAPYQAPVLAMLFHGS